MAETPLRGSTTTSGKILSTRRTLNSTAIRPSDVQDVDIIRRTTTSTTVRERVIDKAIIPYMRSKTVAYSAVGLRPGIVMSGLFDGTTIGITQNTVSPDGTLNGTFIIPPGIPTGTKIFELVDATDNTTSASATYTASGQLVTKQKTITSVRNVTDSRRRRTPPVKHWRKKIITTWVDPIAQSFLIDSEGGAFITSIDVFFETKDANLPVSLYIVEMENGVPTSNILPFSHATVLAPAVNTSADATTFTKFTFGDPVYCEAETEYAFVIRTDSDNYNAWISTLGEPDVTTGVGIARQPYLGSMFKSQNSTTWTADQLSDIKFNVNKAVFQTSGSALFANQNASDVEATTLNFHIGELNLPTATTSWSYSHVGITGTVPFVPFETTDFLESNIIVSGSTSLTANAAFVTANPNISPVIDKQRTSIFTTLNSVTGAAAPYNAGTYISQTINLLNTSDDVKVLVEVVKPNAAKNTGPDIDVFVKTSAFKPTNQKTGQNGTNTSTMNNDKTQSVLLGQTVSIYQHDSVNDTVIIKGECIITGFGPASEVYFKAATDITVFNGSSATLEIFVSDDTTLNGTTIAAYSNITSYVATNLVYDTSTGKIWEATANSTGSEPSAVNSDWKEVVSMSMGGLSTYAIAANEQEWQKLKLEEPAMVELDASAQFIEYAYVPETVLNSEFDSFSIKIELKSQNKHDVPVIKALRAIAVY